MDAPELEPAIHHQALRALERINGLSRVIPIAWKPICDLAKENKGKSLRVLDIATGAGDFPRRLWLKNRREKIPLLVEGCDKSETAVRFAQEESDRKKIETRFFRLDALEEKIPVAYDVLTCNLFFHHLLPEEGLRLLKNFKQSQARLVVLNDLERSLPGLWLAFLSSRILTRSSIVHFDAVQSVRNAYQIQEIREIAEEAGLRDSSIRRVWPFRYLFVWRRD